MWLCLRTARAIEAVHAQRTMTSSIRGTLAAVTGHLLPIGRHISTISAGRSQQEREGRISSPDGSDELPALLRTLLLRNREGMRGSSPLESVEVIQAPVARSLALVGRPSEEPWNVAFRLFSEAVQKHGVVPSIAHINVLLDLTIRGRCWRQEMEVEAFVERIFAAAYQLRSEKEGHSEDGAESYTPQGVAIHRFLASMHPTTETYELLMEAAVKQGRWLAAITYFSDARVACLPVTDTSLLLAAQACLIAEAHSGAVQSNTSCDTSHSVKGVGIYGLPLGKDSNLSPFAQEARIFHKRQLNYSRAQYVWELALQLFTSYRHCVHQSRTVATFMTLLIHVRQYEAVLHMYRDCGLSIVLERDVHFIASRAARELGDWVFSLSLIEREAQDTTLLLPLMEDAVYTLRRTRRYRDILLLYTRLHCSRMWSPRALLVVAQAAMARRDLQLVLELLEEKEGGYGIGKECHWVGEEVVSEGWGVPLSTNPTGTFFASAGSNYRGWSADKALPLEIFDVALRSIQMELIRQRNVIERMADSCSTSSIQMAGSPVSCGITQDLSSLSVKVYENFLLKARWLLGQIGDSEEPPDPTLAVCSPLLRLLDSTNTAPSPTSSDGGFDGTRHSPWEAALAHTALVRRPNAIVVGLTTHVLQLHRQWEAALALLAHVIRCERGAKVSLSRYSHSQTPRFSGCNMLEGGSELVCTIITAASVRHAVWSAALAQRGDVAVRLTQSALTCGWIDSPMAFRLLHDIRRSSSTEQHYDRRVNSAKGCMNSLAFGVNGTRLARLQSHNFSDGARSSDLITDALLPLVALSGVQGGVLSPFAPTILEVIRILQCRGDAESICSAVRALRARLESVMNLMNREWKCGRPSEAGSVFALATRALFHHVASSYVDCPALWHECLEFLQRFRSPLCSASTGALEMDEAMFASLCTLVRCCERQNEEFVRAVVLGWLLGNDFNDVSKCIISGNEIGPRGMSPITCFSLELMMEALMWSGRNRTKDLVRSISAVLMPLFPTLVNGLKGNKYPCRVRSSSLKAMTVAVECLVSGSHDDVLNDCATIRKIMLTLLRVPELTNEGGGKGEIALRDVLSAVLDKVRRKLHFFIEKITINTHCHSHDDIGSAVSSSPGVKKVKAINKTEEQGRRVEELLQNEALAHMDICEMFIQQFMALVGNNCMLTRDAELSVERVMECIWTTNHSLFVWGALFRKHSTLEGIRWLEVLKCRYRRLFCAQVSVLPPSCVTLQRVERWLTVMSSSIRNVRGIDVAEDGEVRENYSSSVFSTLVNDITTLETWQDSRFDTLKCEGCESDNRGLEESVVSRILEGIHSITLSAARQSTSVLQAPTSLGTLVAATPNDTHSSLVEHPMYSPFNEPSSTITVDQVRTLHNVGSTLIHMHVCEGRIRVPQTIHQCMSWYYCPREVLNSILTVVQSIPRNALESVWNPAALVRVFEALRVQSRAWALLRMETEGPSVESQAAFLLLKLTTSPAVRASVRLDSSVCSAILLSLEPVDVERSAAVRHAVSRLVLAFPRLLEQQFLRPLMIGSLSAAEIRALDPIMEYIAVEFSSQASRCSPALQRTAAMWLLLCRPREIWHHSYGHPGADSGERAEEVFSRLMLVASMEFTEKSAGTELMRWSPARLKTKKEQNSCYANQSRADFIASSLAWEQALQLIANAQEARTFSSVELSESYFAVVNIFGDLVPQGWREQFFAKLLSRAQSINTRWEESTAPDTSSVVWKLTNGIAGVVSQQSVQSLNLHQLREQIWHLLKTSSVDFFPDSFDDVWKFLFSYAGRLLRDRTLYHGCFSEVAAPESVSLSCVLIQRCTVLILCHCVHRCSSGSDPLMGRWELATIACSLLMVIELAVPGRSLNFLLQNLRADVLARVKYAKDTTSCHGARTNAPDEGVVLCTLLSCTTLFLAQPGLIETRCRSSDLITTSTMHVLDNIYKRTEALAELLFQLTCDYVTQLDPAEESERMQSISEVAHEHLMSLVELAGRSIASTSRELLLGGKEQGKVGWCPTENSNCVERAARHFVKASLLLGAWRDIYWLSVRLAEYVQTSAACNVEKWRWIVGLLPAMVVASVRTTGSIESQITTALKPLPLHFLRPLSVVLSAEARDSGLMCAEHGTMRGFLLRLQRCILLRTGAVMQNEFYARTFVGRLSLAQPLVELGVLLGLHTACSGSKERVRATLLFYLTDEEYALLEAAVVSHSRGMAVAQHQTNGNAVKSSAKMPRWENAIALVCEPNRRVLYSALRHQTDGNARTTHDPSRVKELREALFVLHSACITGQVPWQVAVELFSRANGPPHTMQVFPAFYSEMIIGKCSSWSTALHIFEHSLITVRRPTRVQQLLAQLILQRMRTDPLWNASASRLTPIDTAAGEGRGFISWEVALWLYARLTRKRMEPPIPQRTMIELLRHCVYNREAALSMYDAYWAQGYKRIEGVNPFLSLLRAARVSRCEESALRAMRDYIRCCEERDSVVCVNKSCVVKPHTVTAEGNATLCRSFMSLCLSGVISKRASERVASALRKRGCIGEVEELIIMGAGHGMSGTTGDK